MNSDINNSNWKRQDETDRTIDTTGWSTSQNLDSSNIGSSTSSTFDSSLSRDYPVSSPTLDSSNIGSSTSSTLDSTLVRDPNINTSTAVNRDLGLGNDSNIGLNKNTQELGVSDRDLGWKDNQNVNLGNDRNVSTTNQDFGVGRDTDFGATTTQDLGVRDRNMGFNNDLGRTNDIGSQDLRIRDREIGLNTTQDLGLVRDSTIPKDNDTRDNTTQDAGIVRDSTFPSTVIPQDAGLVGRDKFVSTARHLGPNEKQVASTDIGLEAMQDLGIHEKNIGPINEETSRIVNKNVGEINRDIVLTSDPPITTADRATVDPAIPNDRIKEVDKNLNDQSRDVNDRSDVNDQSYKDDTDQSKKSTLGQKVQGFVQAVKDTFSSSSKDKDQARAVDETSGSNERTTK